MGNAVVDFSGRPFHFIGIGGIGMSAIAHILAEKNVPVSGSDVKLNHITQRLSDRGVRVFMQQDASNLSTFATDQPSSKQSASFLPQVVCSTAIDPSNVEYRAALDLGCPVFHRSDVLAALLQGYTSIAVGGTHGKTTTSSLIAYLLLEAGMDPTIVVGGEVDAWNGNARLGHGTYLVAEADESDGSLVKFAPHIGIVTNIELDHPDHYESLDEVITIFQRFRSQSDVFIGCVDCPTLRNQFKIDISYGLDESTQADYTVTDLRFHADQTCAMVCEHGQPLGTLKLRLLGRHNLSNALAAVAVGRYVGIPFQKIASILATFDGAHRRFEKRGCYSDITFLDDYAHHPSELKATLTAARTQASVVQSGDRKRIVAVFQPHRYSRTATFLEDFAQSFNEADLIVISDIYSAGEQKTYGMSGRVVAEAIAQHHPHVIYRPTLTDVEIFLKDALKSGDLVLFLGAGNLNKVIPDLLDFYRQKQDQVLQSSVYGS
ncbi:MAG: UDP-N-acetylmuramate--L-alanine ligase [Cyanobacteria bacterium P01_A01_bin.37]